MHPFDWGTLTWGRLPVGFYTLILFIIKWHIVRLPFRPSVSSCHAVYLALFVIIYQMWISKGGLDLAIFRVPGVRQNSHINK